MRCEYCGWDNPSNISVCEKCGQSLTEYTPEPVNVAAQDSSDRPTERRTEFNPKKTVRECGAAAVEPSGRTCNECGYELSETDTNCPCCGEPCASITPGADANTDFKKTVRPNRKLGKKTTTDNPKFTLTPVPEDGETIDQTPLEFNASEVSLNRANTEPENRTITSGQQATIACIDGKWIITDKSELKTTFVQAAEGIEIKDGSIIILGDRIFKFGC